MTWPILPGLSCNPAGWFCPCSKCMDHIVDLRIIMNSTLLLLIFWGCIIAHADSWNVDDFGAVENDAAWQSAVRNSRAFMLAVEAAHQSSEDKEVFLSHEKIYYFSNITVRGVNDVAMIVDGTMRFSDITHQYGFQEAPGNASLLLLEDTSGIQLRGSGTIDGQGLPWWRLCYAGRTYRHIDFFHITFFHDLYRR